MKNAKLKFAISTVISVVAAFAIFLVVLMLAQTHHHTFDLTQDQRFTISPQSKQAAQELPNKVEALAFLFELDSDGRRNAEQLLNQYKDASNGKLTFRVVDPKSNPLVAKKYDVRMPGCVVFTTEAKRTSRASSIDETQLTNALMNLADVSQKKVYFLTGHGEVGSYSRTSQQNVEGKLNMSQLRIDMASEGFQGADLKLAETKKIPDDASVVVIPGPTSELLPAEEKILEDWIAKGGRVMLLLEMESANKYDQFLQKYGFKASDELVIDEMAQMVGAEPVYALGLQYNQESPIVKDFTMTTLYKLSRTVEASDKLPAGAKVVPFVTTGPNAYSIKLSDVLGRTEVKVKEDDIVRQGSLALAAAGTYPVADAQAKDKKAEDKKADAKQDKADKLHEGRVVVFGDSEFCCNELYKAVGNRDLILNALNWLAASENHITVRAKENNAEPLMLDDKTATRIKVFLIIALPLCVLILGILNARRRRS